MRACGAAALAIGVAAILLAVMWAGEAPADVSAGEEHIQEAILRLDRAATAVDGARAAQRLAVAFRVAPRVVAELQDQKLDFGEVAAVLALAEAGRISSDQILALWATARLNWEQIAGRLGVDVSTLLGRLETVRRGLLAAPPAPPR
jgi:hypothetical protein